ncbi:hypothetical protein KCH_52820 [Kitasatospora cheerisanensis KCTC 2395]|uniref:Uncharacterized protein n=1 Tax=Kitasatospora cheerisanensis KCTC 2395 TaxID=1348663 RepID=A0A066YNU8_9ACTN|nr:hypothetical protein KCH_52820 [Kitasatospora cheerisanensis KCTC 2395]
MPDLRDPLQRAVPRGRQHQAHRAAVGRVGGAGDQAGLLQGVDHGGRRAGRDPQPLGELAQPHRLGALAAGRVGERAQRPALGGGDAVRLQPLHGPPADPLHRPGEGVGEFRGGVGGAGGGHAQRLAVGPVAAGGRSRKYVELGSAIE